MLNIATDRFVFIDTETGGIDPEKHSLLSVGLCVWDKNYGIIDTLELLIKSEEYNVTRHAKEMNKFSLQEHNSAAIPQKDAINIMLDFCHKHLPDNVAIPLIGHNIQFDVNFLKVLFKNNNRSFNQYFSHRYIDTYSVYKTFIIAGRIPYNFESSAQAFKYFGIKVNGRHSALGDCIATVELYEKLLNLLPQK